MDGLTSRVGLVALESYWALFCRYYWYSWCLDEVLVIKMLGYIMWEMVVEIEILLINMIMLAIKDTGYALMFFFFQRMTSF